MVFMPHFDAKATSEITRNSRIETVLFLPEVDYMPCMWDYHGSINSPFNKCQSYSNRKLIQRCVDSLY